MAAWHLRHGRWWMVQWTLDYWFSLGVHLDLKPRRCARTGERYAPYVDLHLGCLILSFGVNPVRSGELESVISVSRGGNGDTHQDI